MRSLIRFLCNFIGGMLGATAVVLVYVYLFGAPGLPRLPIIGLPHTYVALVLLLAWSLPQSYLSLLGVIVDGLLSLFGLRESPRARMAMGHGFAVTATLLLLAWHYRPGAPTSQIVVIIPLAIHTAVRLIAGRVPNDKSIHA